MEDGEDGVVVLFFNIIALFFAYVIKKHYLCAKIAQSDKKRKYKHRIANTEYYGRHREEKQSIVRRSIHARRVQGITATGRSSN